MKRCPYCSEDIQDSAIKCRYCGEWLEKKEDPSSNKVEPGQIITPPAEHTQTQSPTTTPQTAYDSSGEDANAEKIIREAELKSSTKVQNIAAKEEPTVSIRTGEVKQEDDEFIESLKSSVSKNELNTIPEDDLLNIYNRVRSVASHSGVLDMELSKAINAVSAEVKKRGLSKFTESLKSSVSKNELNTIPGDDLLNIYNRAKSIAAYSDELDIELSKAMNALLDEIKKRGLSPDAKPKEIPNHKASSIKTDNGNEYSKWVYVITIPIIVIVIALGVNKMFFTKAPKTPSFRLQEYYEANKAYYGIVPLEYVAKDDLFLRQCPRSCIHYTTRRQLMVC